MQRRIRLSITTCVTIVCCVAAIPLGALLAAAKVWSVDNLRAEHARAQEQASLLAARTFLTHVSQLRARLDIAASVVKAGGAQMLQRASDLEILEAKSDQPAGPAAPDAPASDASPFENISPLYLEDGRYVANLSRPVTAQDGTKLVVVTRLRLESIEARLSGANGQISLTDQTGTTVVLTSASRHDSGGAQRTFDAVRTAPVRPARVPVVAGWTLMAEGSPRQLEIAESRLKQGLMLGGFGCITLSTLLLYGFARRSGYGIEEVIPRSATLAAMNESLSFHPRSPHSATRWRPYARAVASSNVRSTAA